MSKTISVRLDDEAMRALRTLEARGRSRSQAIRGALLDSARRDQTLREQAERVAADADDRREIAEIHALLDEYSEPW